MLNKILIQHSKLDRYIRKKIHQKTIARKYIIFGGEDYTYLPPNCSISDIIRIPSVGILSCIQTDIYIGIIKSIGSLVVTPRLRKLLTQSYAIWHQGTLTSRAFPISTLFRLMVSHLEYNIFAKVYSDIVVKNDLSIVKLENQMESIWKVDVVPV